MKIVFVILHYMAIKETEQSVEYIRANLDTADYHIVIVDNASSNHTGATLKKSHQGEPDLTVILNQKNEGFAGGNNVGFRYAKKLWDPEYIVLMNNDVFLTEKSLIKKVDKEYAESHFAVLGPMIMTKDGRCDVNPQKSEFTNAGDIERKIHHYKKDLRRYKYYYAPLYYMLAAVKGALVGKPKQPELAYLKRQENIKLHGCFLIFSKEYMKSFDGLDESTFLFWEEEILYKHMISNSKKMVYDPEIKIFHMEDAATDVLKAKKREKMIFMLTHYIDSLEKLKELYVKYEEVNEKQREKNA
ncbi:glycosyltransferase family 2 protein [Clostridium sp. C105KSO13]|uniref:glycosyltransferase family 2 protein n=1 Tax=Clostridium sp. C105KSO13 TaxID=1776045 RepID=UPI00159EEB2B|nr:glycosyltransferase [Clostridium sp. C105KSO13]